MRAAVIVMMLSRAARSSTQRVQSDQAFMAPVLQFVRALTYVDLDALAESFAADATLFMPFDRWSKRIEGTTAKQEAA